MTPDPKLPPLREALERIAWRETPIHPRGPDDFTVYLPRHLVLGVAAPHDALIRQQEARIAEQDLRVAVLQESLRNLEEDIAELEAELAKLKGTRMFPIQIESRAAPHPMQIPWIIAELAYSVYAAKYGRGQSLERLAERGGFAPSEMDKFLPGWRMRCEEHTAPRRDVQRDK